MGKLTRLGATAVVSGGLLAGLWMGLQFGAAYDPGAASAAGIGLAAFAATLGIAWSQLADDASRGSLAGLSPGTGTLKGVTSTFADRIEEWANVRTSVGHSRSRKETRAALMVYGMPGVGKSEFAQYAAHKLVADFSRYARRRQLQMLARQVELHGLEGLLRTDPRDALRAQLDLDSPDPRRATMNLDELSAEWRKYLQGNFLVLVLNNADDEAQVLPFLPGGSSFILLITGRRMLQGLIGGGITPFRLEVLTEAGAIQMVRNIVNRPHGDDDHDAIAQIARLCGYHPLAITLAVSTLAQRPNVSFASRLTQMKGHPSQLLAIDEYANKGSGGVARSFDLSYTHLPEAAKLVLRRLGLAPVPSISVEAATAIAGLPVDVITSSLRELVEEALIAHGAGENYELHDLIRRYARSLAARDDPAENEAAVNRLLAYYNGAAAYADSLLTRQPAPRAVEPPAPPVNHHFVGLHVLAWVRAELSNLLACADYVVENAESGDRRDENIWVVSFADALAGILRNEGQWRRSIELQTQAIKAAEKINAPLGVANALAERGMLNRLTAELKFAVADLERAISIYRTAGGESGQTGEAHALNTFGVVLDQLDRRDEGRRCLSEALDIYRRLNDPLGEANVLHDQGMAEFSARRYDKAVQLMEQALALYKTIDQPLGMAHAYSNLARAQQHAGAEHASADNLRLARVRYQDLGNKLGEINVLVRLGSVLRYHDRGEAVKMLNDAMTLSIEIGNQLALIDALDELGEIYLANGERKTALGTWSRAVKIAREHGVSREEAKLTDKIRGVR